MNRISIRLDEDLYGRLLLFAKGRSKGQTPEVSTIVREALEQYLETGGCQTVRQTKQVYTLSKRS